MVPLALSDMVNSSKQLKGVMYGGMNPRASMPMLLSLYQAGALKLDELVTRRYRLDEINDAIIDLREGRNIRGIIEFPDASRYAASGTAPGSGGPSGSTKQRSGV